MSEKKEEYIQISDLDSKKRKHILNETEKEVERIFNKRVKEHYLEPSAQNIHDIINDVYDNLMENNKLFKNSMYLEKDLPKTIRLFLTQAKKKNQKVVLNPDGMFVNIDSLQILNIKPIEATLMRLICKKIGIKLAGIFEVNNNGMLLNTITAKLVDDKQIPITDKFVKFKLTNMRFRPKDLVALNKESKRLAGKHFDIEKFLKKLWDKEKNTKKEEQIIEIEEFEIKPNK